MKKFLIAFGAGALVLNFWLGSADARPGYMMAFKSTYPNVTAAETAKCNVCHAPDNKKVRNDYGKALGEALGAANVKDEAQIKAALKKVEETKKEFGDKLKAGKLPVE